MLTRDQVAYYETFGFLILRQMFSKGETDELRNASLSAFQGLRGGRPYFGKDAEGAIPFFERHPRLSALLDDDRIHQIPESLLGPDFFLDGTEGHLRVGDTPWHGDTEFSEDIGHIKVTIYLDPVAKDTGCLRVIPGSHRHESPDYLEVLRPRNYDPDFRPFGISPTEVPCWPLETEPGDVVVFPERILHGSFGGWPGRHQLCASFVANPVSESQERQMVAFHRKAKYSFRPARSYVDSDRPRIRKMVAKMVELGFEPNDV